MVTLRVLAVAFLLCMIAACTTFGFKYYALDYDGQTLVGDKPEHDLKLVTCKGDEQVKQKCVVMFIDEFERLRTHLADVEKRAEACDPKD